MPNIFVAIGQGIQDNSPRYRHAAFAELSIGEGVRKLSYDKQIDRIFAGICQTDDRINLHHIAMRMVKKNMERLWN